jgi:uncharacterized protein
MTELVAFGMELRLDASDGRLLSGLAVPYGVVTMNTSYPGGERFARGAFKRTVANQKGRLPKLFRNHDHDQAIGVAAEFRDTDDGLLASWRIADTPSGNAVLQEVREGVLDSLSVGFRALREDVVEGVREVREAHLFEVSLVPLPAYLGAQVLSLRSADEPPQLPPRPEVDLEFMLHIGGRIG